MKRLCKFSYLLVMPAIVATMILLFALSWKYDNKYTYPSTQGIGGVLFLDQGELEESPYLFLIHGWNYYADVLLTPDTISAFPVTENVFIGQYNGFEHNHPKASPHGAGSWQLTIVLPKEEQAYALHIPEIFSSYRLYINNRLALSQGCPDLDKYSPRIKSDTVYFTASGETQLLFAVADYSGFYSGIVYPPIFGLSDSVTDLIQSRALFEIFVFSAALCVGVFYLSTAVTMHGQKIWLPSLFCAICLCSACILIFPLFHFFMDTGVQPWYTAEFFLRAFLLLLVSLLTGILTNTAARWLKLSMALSALACIATLLASLFAPYYSAEVLKGFSFISRCHKLFTALWILFLTLRQSYRKNANYPKLIFAASLIFSLSLLGELLLPLFDPIRFGWFSEISAVFFVFVLGIALWSNITSQYRKNVLMTLQMYQRNAQIALQQKHYEELTEQMEQMRHFRHDTRHHFETILQLLKNNNTAEAERYLSELAEDSSLSTPLSFCSIYPLDVLLRYYYAKAQSQHIAITIQVALAEELRIPSSDLCVIFGNLLENAYEACERMYKENKDTDRRRAEIYLQAQMSGGHMMKLEVRNTYNGEEVVSDGEGYLSSKGKDRRGIGLQSVQAITAKYNGVLEVKQKKEGESSWFLVQLFLGRI
ncbi:MAG: GHKL domain-containing protein [bacterium]|nr:GHKL domain-containing protein [bacterium]